MPYSNMHVRIVMPTSKSISYLPIYPGFTLELMRSIRPVAQEITLRPGPAPTQDNDRVQT